MIARVIALNSFPVKGCAPVSLQAAQMTAAGLAHDRSFMVIDEQGLFRSQRRDPRLALIQPTVSADGERITVRIAGMNELEVAVDLAAERRAVTMFGSSYRGIDQGDVIADWFTDALGAPSRLVRVPPEHDRVADGETPGTPAYADGAALLLASVSSLHTLNARITERGSSALPMSRFRANVVVDGWDEPHVEDRARRVSIGDCRLGYSKLAVRCAVTMVDQNTGVKVGPEPIRTLAGYRRTAQGGVAFGAKFSVLRSGKLSVGDDVTVTSWGGNGLPD